MDSLIQEFLNYARGIWRRRWYGLAVAWLIGVAGIAGVFLIPDQYEASARLYVDTKSILKPLMSGLAIQPDMDEQVNILSRTLISRPNIEKVIHMADLNLKVRDTTQEDALVDRLIKDIRMKVAGEVNLYSIEFRASKPEDARRVVQSLLSIFVESGIGDKRRDSDSAKRFIEDQIKTYEAKLLEAENRVKQFKLENLAWSSVGGENYFDQMAKVGRDLAEAESALESAIESRDALKRQLAGEEPVFLSHGEPASGQDISIPEIDARIDAQKRALDEMLRRFTEQHPDVLGTRRVIEQLEQQKREQVAARQAAAPPVPQMNSADANPVYQHLKVARAEAEALVASLRARVNHYRAQYNKFRGAAELVPKIEAAYAQLNRDYEVQKRNYESLIARRESAAMTGEMEETARTVDFRIIDPPRVSPQPVAPNRLLLLPAVLVLALGAGVVTSLAVSQLFPTFYEAKALRQATGRPVLGTVSLLTDGRLSRRRRRQNIAFLSGLSSLLGLFGSALVLLLLIGRAA